MQRGVKTPIIKECIERAKEMLFQGHSISEIKIDLLAIDSTLNVHEIRLVLNEAYDRLHTTVHRDREYIFQLHMSRYEELYKRAMNMRNNHGIEFSPTKDWNIIVNRFQTAMRILKLKEELIGLHNKDIVIEIENNNTTVIKEGEPDHIMLTGLSFDEKVELLALLKEARTVPIEGDRQIVIKKKTLNENNEPIDETYKFQESAIDIQYEEMPEKVIDKMKEEPSDEKIEYMDSPIVEDYVDRTVTTRTFDDVSKMIDNDLKNKFEKIMRRTKPKK